MNKTIAILGATGSVGTQAQDVARRRRYRVALMSAQKNVEAAERAAREFLPKVFVMTDERAASELAVKLSDTSVKVYGGADSVISAIEGIECETVVNAILGEAGLAPSISAIKMGRRLALANKESLVIAGDILWGLLRSIERRLSRWTASTLLYSSRLNPAELRRYAALYSPHRADLSSERAGKSFLS